VSPETVARFADIEVSPSIDQPHRLTARTRRHFAALQQRIERAVKHKMNSRVPQFDALTQHEDNGRYWCRAKDGFQLVVSFGALERALSILDPIAHALTKEGFRFDDFIPGPNADYRERRVSGLVATKNGERIAFSMREGYSKRERTAKELLEAERDHRYLTKYEGVPNGRLTLELKGQECTDATFRDAKSENLEHQVGAIVATFVEAVPQQKEARAAREAEEIRRREAEYRAYQERERVRQEKEMLEKLLAEAQQAQQFRELRAYLEDLTEQAQRQGGLTAEGQGWVERIRELIERYDPAVGRLQQLRSRRGP
jgi:hypothetical protein